MCLQEKYDLYKFKDLEMLSSIVTFVAEDLHICIVKQYIFLLEIQSNQNVHNSTSDRVTIL